MRAPAEAMLALRGKAAARLGLDEALVARKIAERAAARVAKDFARSDALRDELVTMGIAIMDGPQGTSWKIA